MYFYLERRKEEQAQFTLLTSIPGIGPITALFLIIIADGFSKFDNAPQLFSYVGIA